MCSCIAMLDWPARVVQVPRISSQRVSLAGEVQEGLLAAHRDCSVPRFLYDWGRLEIMSLSPEHERLKHVVAIFVDNGSSSAW
jgi:hypothetical protein